MLTWKLAYQLLSEHCLIPQVGPQGCESPRLTALCEELRQILSDSDIVWPKYGSDTIEELAQRIVNKLKAE